MYSIVHRVSIRTCDRAWVPPTVGGPVSGLSAVFEAGAGARTAILQVLGRTTGGKTATASAGAAQQIGRLKSESGGHSHHSAPADDRGLSRRVEAHEVARRRPGGKRRCEGSVRSDRPRDASAVVGICLPAPVHFVPPALSGGRAGSPRGRRVPRRRAFRAAPGPRGLGPVDAPFGKGRGERPGHGRRWRRHLCGRDGPRGRRRAQDPGASPHGPVARQDQRGEQGEDAVEQGPAARSRDDREDPPEDARGHGAAQARGAGEGGRRAGDHRGGARGAEGGGEAREEAQEVVRPGERRLRRQGRRPVRGGAEAHERAHEGAVAGPRVPREGAQEPREGAQERDAAGGDPREDLGDAEEALGRGSGVPPAAEQ